MNRHILKLLSLLHHDRQIRQRAHSQQQASLKTPAEWSAYWHSQGQMWRTEPEIDTRRQQELSKHRAIVPDIEKGIYSFKGMILTRADVEWLLATHENGRGPVNWIDEHEHERKGLDLRGANLRQVDLSLLPLARLRGGLAWDEHNDHTTGEQYSMAAVHLEGARLYGAHLEGVRLNSAYLEGADLGYAHLERADLIKIHLEGANLKGAFLTEADLSYGYLTRADLSKTRLGGGYMKNVMLSDEKRVGPRLVDIRWGDINLAVVNWTQLDILGEEHEARQTKQYYVIEGEGQIRKRVDKYEAHQAKQYVEEVKDRATRLNEYETAVRANRQLAIALQNHALNEDATHFAYRAQVLQRKVLWMQREIGRWLFSLLLALLAGYGYRMWRILAAYMLVVSVCTIAYFVLGMFYEPHLSFLDATLTSITAFHGRVFSEPFSRPGEPQLWITAFEAVMGLVIESVFIAMLVQKFFGK
jgi:uncharacterized protein YjbI with pentapeptide repeats